MGRSGSCALRSSYCLLGAVSQESYQRLFLDFLRDKYTDDPPDLIMLTYVGNLGVAEKLLEKLS